MVTTLKDIGAERTSSIENLNFYLYSSKSKTLSEWQEWGCCMSIRANLDTTLSSCNITKNTFASHCIILLRQQNIPEKYRDPEFLKKYLNFFNGIGEGGPFSLHFLGKGKVDPELTPEDLKELEIKYHIFEDTFIFSFKMQRGGPVHLNLASLSFIRFLQFSRYWFYINHITTLRENEDLADLNNLEILQLAAYGENKAKSGDLHGLWHYKSPVVAENYSYYIENKWEVIYKNLNNGWGLNYAFSGKQHVYDIRQIRQLFREGEYVSIYNMLIDPVDSVTTGSGKLLVNATINGEKGTWGVAPVNDQYLNSAPTKIIKIK